ncbi:unannotated protein [freshwater metagenome]|uniref:Unannotated protein n=1 Tax=freshwater metagenome TaxID=449393 RepID=A0A6J6KJY6_9ZZZZ
MGVATPVNVGNGLNTTAPVVGFTVYVPWPETVSVVKVQLGAVSPGPHNNTAVANNGNDAAPGVSFESGVYVWFVS